MKGAFDKWYARNKERYRLSKFDCQEAWDAALRSAKWMDANKEKPPVNIAVLVCLKDADYLHTAIWDQVHWVDAWHWYPGYKGDYLSTVTYWLPLPKSPARRRK